MKQFITILCIVFASMNIMGQSATGRYVSRMSQDGMIYFIMPQKISHCSEIKRFEYDMTCLSWTDSVTVNFTFKSKSVDKPTHLKIESCGVSYICENYSLLFTDIVRGGYEIRVTSKFPLIDIEKIILCDESPIFSFTQDGITRTAAYSKGAWKKDKKKLQDIFNIFRLSRLSK